MVRSSAMHDLPNFAWEMSFIAFPSSVPLPLDFTVYLFGC